MPFLPFLENQVDISLETLEVKSHVINMYMHRRCVQSGLWHVWRPGELPWAPLAGAFLRVAEIHILGLVDPGVRQNLAATSNMTL